MNKHCFQAFVFLFLLIPSLCLAWSGKVVHVADGDTITVLNSGQKVKVRLYGIDTPEKKQWYGQNAKAFTSSQVMGKTVDVQVIDTDRYGRAVGVVTVGDLVLNKHLLEYGYAWLYDRYCKKAFCHAWAKAETEARKAKRGVWKNAKAVPPWEYRKSKRKKSSSSRAKAPAAGGSGCECKRNRYNCSDFKTQAQAQECFDLCMDVVGRDVHKLDRDRDGRVCESLR